jgi:hypothetical protein
MPAYLPTYSASTRREFPEAAAPVHAVQQLMSDRSKLDERESALRVSPGAFQTAFQLAGCGAVYVPCRFG